MAPLSVAGPTRKPDWALSGSPGGFSEPTFQIALLTLQTKFELSPTTTGFVKSLKNLSKNDKRALAAGFRSLTRLSSGEQSDFADGIRRELASPEGESALQDAADVGGNACKDISQQFAGLQQDLRKIDNDLAAAGVHHEAFALMLEAPEQTFENILKDCKSLSMATSVYTSRFVKVILDFVSDDSRTTTERLEVIDKFIQDASELQSTSNRITRRLNRLKNEFAAVMDTFESFSNTGRSQEFHNMIKATRKKLDDLDRQLNALKATIVGITAAPGALAPLTAGLAAIFPPAAVFILAAGLVIGAGLAVTAAILGNQLHDLEEDRQEEQDHLDALLAADKAAEKAQKDAGQKLQVISSNNRHAFGASIDLITGVFGNVSVDAQSIRDWLQQGADVSARPKSMQLPMESAGELYLRMAKYLETFSQHL